MTTVKHIIARISIYLPEAILGIIANVLWLLAFGLYKFNFELQWAAFINKQLKRDGWLNHWFYKKY